MTVNKKMTEESLRVVEFYSSIGGMHSAYKGNTVQRTQERENVKTTTESVHIIG